MKHLIIIVLLLPFMKLSGQPYIDLISIRYVKSPDAGIHRRNFQQNKFDYFYAGINIPIISKKDSSAIIFSPFIEKWNISLDNLSYLPEYFQGFALPVAYQRPFTEKWTIAFTVIPRWNGYNGKLFEKSFQLGGAVVATYKRQSNLKYKLGMYYNSEFSGPFIVPLAGIDWRPDSRNTFFGVLPGHLIWEHKARKRFYYGAVFRAVTNTYYAGKLNNQDYFLRIDDNQLSAYSDIYLSKKIVFNLEAGHSILRRLRMGYTKGSEKYFYKEKANDNWIFRASLTYRLRL